MSVKKKIRIPATTYNAPSPEELTGEDVRWAQIVLRSIDGLAAIAEAHAEACETEWLGMQCLLEDLRETQKGIVEDFENRIGGKDE